VGSQKRRYASAWRSSIGGDLRRLFLWVATENRCRGFYERLGGVVVGEQTTEVLSVPVELVAYYWPDLTALAS